MLDELDALWWWRVPCLRRTVIVNLKDDPTIALRGVLWSTRGQWFTLRAAEVLKSGEPPHHADGELIVHRSNVAFFQVEP